MKTYLLPALLLGFTALAGCSSSVEEQISPFTVTDVTQEPLSQNKVLRLTHHTTFKYDSVFVGNASINNIMAHAEFIIKHPNTRVLVEGHADDSGDEEYNRELGMRRAKRVANVLMTYGVKEKQIILRSYSTSKPLSPITDSLNRRATIIY